MKRSSLILIVTFALLIAGMFASNAVLKKEYDHVDKTDTYWTYGKINEQAFKYLKIVGGNLTNIAFEPAKKSSVRVLKTWDGFENHTVSAAVRNDTLYLTFPNTYRDIREREYFRYNTLVRIFSPELLVIEGDNTNIGLYKMKQPNFNITLRGKSTFEVESYLHRLDSVDIRCSDSAHIVFEISPDSLGTTSNVFLPENAPVVRKTTPGGPMNPVVNNEPTSPAVHSWEAMSIRSARVNASGVSLVDLGHAQIGNIQLSLADTSGIILSGQSLKRYVTTSAH